MVVVAEAKSKRDDFREGRLFACLIPEQSRLGSNISVEGCETLVNSRVNEICSENCYKPSKGAGKTIIDKLSSSRLSDCSREGA